MLLGYWDKLGCRPLKETEIKTEPSDALKELHTIEFNSYPQLLSISHWFFFSKVGGKPIVTKNPALNAGSQNGPSTPKFLKKLVSIFTHSSMHACMCAFIQLVHWKFNKQLFVLFDSVLGSVGWEWKHQVERDWDLAFQKLTVEGVVRMHIPQIQGRWR